jgi:bacterioferritin-associated ferredoxin
MYICLCNAITESQVRRCAREGACTVRDLECQLGLGVSCGRCRHAASEVLNETRSETIVVLAGTSA